MNQKRLLAAFFSFLVPVLFLLTSCSGIMGYSVLLWDYPEKQMQDGTVVPVYIRSNISHVYVIGIPGTKEKVELPLWQISEPQSRRKAKKTAERYAAYRHQYAYALEDGLPIRATASNTAKQVYRLRENEVIKLLYEGKGQAVMAGKDKKLEGKWLFVMAKDGSSGWCYSYSLKQFETDKSGKSLGAAAEPKKQSDDSVIKNVLAKKWYPDSYKAMIESGNIDLSVMNASYGFNIDADNKKVVINLADVHKSWDYTGVTKTDENEYTLNAVPIVITVKSDSFIVIRYTDDDGKPKEYNFITVEQSVADLIAGEKTRRAQLYARILSTGPSYTSANYGTIVFSSDNSFMWKSYQLLIPSVISSDAGNAGMVSLKYFVSPDLVSSYDGVLTFKFANMSGEVNFLYKLEKNGIRLEDATGAEVSGGTITARAMSPLVLFFQKD